MLLSSGKAFLDICLNFQGKVLSCAYFVLSVLVILNFFGIIEVHIQFTTLLLFFLMVVTYVLYFFRNISSYFKSWSTLNDKNPSIQVLETVLPTSTAIITVIAMYGVWINLSTVFPLALMEQVSQVSSKETQNRVIGWTYLIELIFIALWTHLIRAQIQIHLLEQKNGSEYINKTMKKIRSEASPFQWYVLVFVRVSVVIVMLFLQFSILDAWNNVPDISNIGGSSFQQIFTLFIEPLTWGVYLFGLMIVWDMIVIYIMPSKRIDVEQFRRVIGFICLHFIALGISLWFILLLKSTLSGNVNNPFLSDNYLLYSIVGITIYIIILVIPPQNNFGEGS